MLGCDPMAIYHHVPDKSALMDGLVEMILAAVRLPAPTGRWDDDLPRSPTPCGPPSWRTPGPSVSWAPDPLRPRPPSTCSRPWPARCSAPVSPPNRPPTAWTAPARVIVGHTLTEGGRPPGGDLDGGEAAHEEAQQQLPPERFPALDAIARAGVRHSADRLFELALDGLVLTLREQRAVP